MEQRLKQLDEEILDWEIQTLAKDCYLRLKRMLAREYMASVDRKFFSPLEGATRRPEVIKADLKTIEESFEKAFKK